ncbi:enoyl-CoA hydratase/isomerase family protein [Desulfuromonas thiophila]|uniref:enoyl-CoA hydratase/isomerase family protein n=1 Tax=Desulfuromonas thiophila TaxID=57664 RepID=UPI0024A7AA52|nr:enoyl-CoA hydratase-related protein [Desulfuromonas thiophila]
MSYQNLLLDHAADGISRITLNRPQQHNSLCPATLEELDQAFSTLGQCRQTLVIVLTGAGDKAFAAGGDVARMRQASPLQARAIALLAARLFERIETLPKVVLAAINGYALGGGCELALACDLRLAADHAQLGQPEINLGIFPGWGGTQRLPRLIGVSRAKRLMFTGERVSAQEALNIGLVDEVVPSAQLLDRTEELARQLADKPQTALAFIKQAVHNGMEMDRDRAIRYEAELFGLCFSHPDRAEGMAAFFDKRPPCWLRTEG